MGRVTDVKQNGGFLLLELCLVVSIILILISASAVPAGNYVENQYLDGLIREMAWDLASVRQHAVGNNSGDPAWRLSVRQKEYVVLEGTRIVKRRAYENGIKLRSSSYRKDFYFDEQGRPKGNQMVVILQGRGGHEKKIIVAAQTGRIRMV